MRSSATVAAAVLATMTALGTIDASTAGADPVLECRMRVPAQVRAGAGVPLRFELVNRGPRRLFVLTWNTPLEGWFGRSLRVTAPDGTEVAYRGPQVKRAAPERSDYATVRPGRRLRATVDLSQVYALERPGRYEIAFEGSLHDVTATVPREPRSPLELKCPVVAVNVLAGGGRR